MTDEFTMHYDVSDTIRAAPKRIADRTESALRDAVAAELRRQGWTVIPPAGGRDHLEAAEKAHTPSTPTDDEIEALLAVLDNRLGLCYCQRYTGERHDHNPPCSRVKLADEILTLRRTSVPEPSAEPSDAQVEVAAQTLAVRMGDGPWEDLLDTFQDDYRHDARAALRAASAVTDQGEDSHG